MLRCCSAAGSYNGGKNRLPCTTCGTGYTTSAPGQTSVDACVMQPGELEDMEVQQGIPFHHPMC
jgi:hypothetical protein